MIAFFRRSPDQTTIDALYGAIVAQARRAEFYQDYGVADTVEGRFDMIVLHAALVSRRLRVEAPALAQGLFDTFCRDMDHNLREMGVGDLSVPKEMRKLGEAFYGRAQAYDRALAADDASLAQALDRNIYGGASRDGAARLAAYARRVSEALEMQNVEAFRSAKARFPEPGGA